MLAPAPWRRNGDSSAGWDFGELSTLKMKIGVTFSRLKFRNTLSLTLAGIPCAVATVSREGPRRLGLSIVEQHIRLENET